MAHYDTRTLAAGCFGKVYREKYKEEWAAMKKVPVHMINAESLNRECRVYEKARHPNIVRLLGEPWRQDGRFHIPMEFITGEELETTIFITQKSKIKLTPAAKATIISGMCAGLFHLHSKDIVHQDIKPDNIMVEHETNRAVIIDLGLAKFFRNGLTSAANMGNEAYSAPEVLDQHGVRDSRSDVWAMGKVIAELCARVRLPTHAVNPTKIQETLAAYPYKEAVSKMVDPNPATRVSMARALSYIREAEVKVKQEERAGGLQVSPHQGDRSPSPARSRFDAEGLKTVIEVKPRNAGADGLHQRGAGLQVSPRQVDRSPSPARSRFQPVAADELKTVVEVKPRNIGTEGLHQRGGAGGVQQVTPRVEVNRSPSPGISRFQPAVPQGGRGREEVKPRFGVAAAGSHQHTGLVPVRPEAERTRSPSPARSRFLAAADPRMKQEDKTALQDKPGFGTRFGGKPTAGLQPRGHQQTPVAHVRPEVNVSPKIEALHKRDEDGIKALVPASAVPSECTAITNLLQQMTPFPVPLPTTGKIQHSRYEYDSSTGCAVFEVKDVELQNGKITKYEGYKTTM
ncbi:uncharacterized protein zmp:0000000881 [Engraulis encrasicolus]|uniref:uncharacterized protein zmp:0000000881 n=1 Tax=Engraulis encrasicolus TaxID=184585 RepID=UPI002FD62513